MREREAHQVKTAATPFPGAVAPDAASGQTAFSCFLFYFEWPVAQSGAAFLLSLIITAATAVSCDGR